MAAGARGYIDLELRDHEAVIARKEIGYLQGDYDLISEGSRGWSTGLGYRSKVRQKAIEEREVMNGRYRSTYSRSDSGSGGESERREIAVPSMDREPGELSSDESDGAIDSEVKVLEIGSRLSNFQNKKRKFPPIVWDRDDRVAIPTVKRENTLETRSPPSLPGSHQEFPDINSILDADVKTSPENAREVDISESSTSTINNDDYVPERTIISCRWANDDEADISGTEGKQVAKRKTGSELAEVTGCRKSASPERGEVKREVSKKIMDVSSWSDGSVCSDEKFEYMLLDYHGFCGKSVPTHCRRNSVDMLQGCRVVDEFEKLNRIDEGTYGVVYRAKDKKTGEIVALKKVKMDKEVEGFPLTSLREINILLSLHHPSIVDFKEVVVGRNIDEVFDVYMVMEYMEHDIKGLMETVKLPYSQSEVKCLMLQLLQGVKYLHDNWVVHRDLKTSNLLLNNRGELKICDFGLSRQYGSPLKPYTQLVVTLWYRSPELLLGAEEYSTAIDMWSVGCIMAELLSKEPLFNGTTVIDQLHKIYMILGTPNETIWPGLSKLPGVKVKFVKHKYSQLRNKFRPTPCAGLPVLSDAGFDLLNKLLTYDPEKRLTAEAALRHEWFREVPLPKSKDFMPTFRAQNGKDRRMRRVVKSRDPSEEQRRKELQQGELGTGGLFGL